MKKQTAVEWLIKELDLDNNSFNMKIINQAKAMEKEQIMEAAERWKGTDFAELYYNETYGGNK